MDGKNEVDTARLMDALTRLTEAQVASERRTARLERIIRWGAIGLVAIAVTTVAVVNDTIGVAFATTEAPLAGQDPTNVVDALNRINQNLAVMGQMGGLMQAGMEAAQSDPVVQKYLKENFPGMEPQQALMAAAGQAVAGGFVVLHRIRADSDVIHKMITDDNLEKAMSTVGQELHLMNVALAAIPYMASNMGSMGYNMNKMGSWVPWGAGW